MAEFIDVRQAGGKLIVLGGSLTLPSLVDTSAQVEGAIRFNPTTQSLEVWCAPGTSTPNWVQVGLVSTQQFLSSGGGTITGSLAITQTLTVSGACTAQSFSGLAYGTISADLAERYHADATYPAGTVLVIGGKNEVTQSTRPSMVPIAGIVSTTPGVKMNEAAGPDETHPYVALRGRVPCLVTGKVSKGDRMVSSNKPGHAMNGGLQCNPEAVIGYALADFDGISGLIEVKV